jgi:hypothetical protein
VAWKLDVVILFSKNLESNTRYLAVVGEQGAGFSEIEQIVVCIFCPIGRLWLNVFLGMICNAVKGFGWFCAPEMIQDRGSYQGLLCLSTESGQRGTSPLEHFNSRS